MRKLILKMSMSVDGFVAGPNGELDWLFETMSDAGRSWVKTTLEGAGAHIMGSRTFYDMRAYWPYSDNPLAAAMNDIPKIVFTKKGLLSSGNTTTAIKDAKTADDANGIKPSATGKALDSWLHPTVCSGDLTEEIKMLKEQQGSYLLAQGGAGFVQNLIATGLVDEYRLVIHPYVLGAGLPIFTKIQGATALQLQSSTPLDRGVIANVYTSK